VKLHLGRKFLQGRDARISPTATDSRKGVDMRDFVASVERFPAGKIKQWSKGWTR
jgi:hypothetical protein